MVGLKGSTLFIERASGAYVFDADGNRFIDYVGSYGPAILGHSDPRVSEAVADQAQKGCSSRRLCGSAAALIAAMNRLT
jgi:glutamate-1-semialdehyde 2,1-aminomutase